MFPRFEAVESLLDGNGDDANAGHDVDEVARRLRRVQRPLEMAG